MINLRPKATVDWDTVSSTPCDIVDTVDVGLLINAETINRTVDRGPSVEDRKATAEFRAFWGPKAELRRFKDGSIVECLVWSPESSERTVVHEIITYAISRHVGEDAASSIEFIGENLSHVLPCLQPPHCLESFREPWMAFEDLQSQLRSLNGLPLQIRQIFPSSAGLRYTSISPPLVHRDCWDNRPMDIVVQFEGSTRWPDDFLAIQRTKVALLMKLSDLLRAANPSQKTKLGLENEGKPFLNAPFLDIESRSASFRLRIYHDRELTLLEGHLKSCRQDLRANFAEAIAAHKRTCIHVPLHTQVIRSLCTRFPLLSPTIRLLKKWCSSHLIYPHFQEEVLELFAARVFTHPFPFAVPGSARAGFLRTLTMLAKWDWRSEPLLVDLNEKMSATDFEALKLRFEGWRKVDPAMNRVTLLVGSTLDPDGSTWTTGHPRTVVAARMTALAKAAHSYIKSEGTALDLRTLFLTSLREYDFLIHLNSKFCPRSDGNDDPSTRTSTKGTTGISNQHQDFCPVRSFIDELDSLHGSGLVLFHDGLSNGVIGGLWSPFANTRPWKVNSSYSTTPRVSKKWQEDGPQATINKTAILSDIARLGGDLISSIEVRNPV